eukprot:2770737-Prymnesium_polylepis.2
MGDDGFSAATGTHSAQRIGTQPGCVRAWGDDCRAMQQADTSADVPGVEVPFDLLRGLVRNPQEAQTIAALDVLASHEACLLEHIFAALAYTSVLQTCLTALVDRGVDPEVNGALVLVSNALEAARSDVQMLCNRADGVWRAMLASRESLLRYAEVNRSLSEELKEEGCALAANKQRLWLVETSLAHRIALRSTCAVPRDP